MSRIGKKPISLPEGVSADINNNIITVKGPKGELSQAFKDTFVVAKDNDCIIVNPKIQDEKNKQLNSYWGLMGKLIRNMVDGVTKGFEKKLLIRGVGYRAQMKGNTLVLTVGFSHPVEMAVPEGIKVEVAENVNITVSGIDKYMVGQFSALIRQVRKPEPYKGKGIKYVDERIRRKVGKTGV